ncbi:hypothetical protein DOY81_001567 [Sarcophaga bullata]|nr:hypothetical protein DOY81_001567 [Sarcophaga bullata]
MASDNTDIVQNTSFKDVPNWLNEHLFEEFLEKDFPSFLEIIKFEIKPAVSTGENYMTIMLRVLIDLQLKDNTILATTYMVKIKPKPEKLRTMIREWKIFFKEHNTYTQYIPAFENYYRKAGFEIKLAPRLLEPTQCHINDDYLILEDLRSRGFKNFNRHLGLDLKHTEAVLKKLAQFHAASAQYFQENGAYHVLYDKCLSCEVDRFVAHRQKMSDIFRKHLGLYGNLEYLETKLKIYSETQPDPFQLKSNWKTNKFNVLNHGDCWSNNIMFQYDQHGQLKDINFIDFQMSRCGSPAQDLIYFLLSSTSLEIKLKHFDYFIHYYHEQLIVHLNLLEYKGDLPSLRDIHVELFKHDYWVYPTVTALMPIVLCESRDDANVDTLINEDNDEFKQAMYSNDLYVRNMHLLLPWLDNRGAFDI